MTAIELDGVHLVHPCHCGGKQFRAGRLMRYQACMVVKCVDCGQRRTYPEPNLGDTVAIYNDGREKYNPQAVAEDETRKAEYAAYAKGILDVVEQHLPAKGRILDVGCNFGDLLFAAHERGWAAEGLEINRGNVDYLRERGFTMYDRPIEDASDVPDDRFDAVATNNVLEHVTDPVAFIAAIRRVLRPGGILFVGVPIFWGPIPVLLKRDSWYSLLPDEHVWQYSESDVTGLMRRADLRVLWKRRGCSGYWGKLSPRPRDLARWLIYKSVKWTGCGDFVALVARNDKRTTNAR